ncbi:uncharacterized protein MYCFIDRAFT_63930 [Pseudocercospora fijiensis CIRAD86]|uniref:SH3 domain-containing protein n=1 Tax=Pseudocercospora fijiensis (strain CIRAD86) TaxID=383855 RepID=M3A4A9_PSEFD|nr:uncharacterized protein MYCFIDRAFT_63930 [Pseudocercospora fijiensis CIRAD86]EME79451.1 hypothetical protein MYCFIDRAFT_63930 [Pseudocercospora fijiensis CIRAD86]
MAALFKVKALYDFEAKEDDDLGFPGGQVIDVTEEVDDNWLEGTYADASGASKSGIFPREFVEKYEPPVPTRPTRPSRPKQEAAPVPAAAPVPVPEPPVAAAQESDDEDELPAPPAASKPQPQAPPVKETPSKKAPPPVAAKSNAFRDRIAAFNQPAAAPIVPGGPKPVAGAGFIKKPFVAPPPMANSYVPPPKPAEPVHKPYIREEDPEIRQRQDDDRAAAEAAGLTAASSEQQEQDEHAQKPQTLKERIARLQQQQMEQAARQGAKKEKKAPPPRKPSESSEHAAEEEAEVEDLTRERSADTERQSLDMPRDRARLPSSQQRKPSIPMSPIPAMPDSELVSDGNEADQSAAGETTEDDTGTIGPEDSDEKHAPLPPQRAASAVHPPKKEADVGDEEDTTEVGDDDDEEDSMDEETRRRMELRERMAKMSGGMGMAGMFGPPGGMPLPGAGMPKKRKEKKPSEDEAPLSPPQPAQRFPMIPVPGLQRVTSPESSLADRNQAAEEGAEEAIAPPSRKATQEDRAVPPPVPKDSRPSQERGVPPPMPNTSALPTPRATAPESRPVPQPPPLAAPQSPGPGSESDDEMSILAPNTAAETSGAENTTPLPIRTNTAGAPPVPGSAAPQSPENRRASYFGIGEPQSATSDKRASRPPPPVPACSPLTSPRPAPPPPPSQGPSRAVTALQQEGDERGESDYEGDYDTDIASSAKHKDALKAHIRDDSYDGSITADDLSSPTAPRAVPPPPPSQAPPKSRPSMDAPRAAPPVPPSRPIPDSVGALDGDEYDPYRYEPGQQRGAPPPVPSAAPMPPRGPERRESSADDLYATSPPRKSMDQPARAVPAPPPTDTASRAPPRQSLDVHRSNTTRRSMDQPRPSGDNGQMAQDVDLAENTTWWAAAKALPPSLQSRNGVDILSESEESTTSKRGGRSTVSKEIYILYLDYSQTIITARYDASNPADVQLEQQHRPPPPKLRQDQLEAYWNQFGRNISEAVNSLGHSKKDTTVGDGTPASLPADLIKANPAALLPIGNKAYGAVVYANLANASTQQFDEIRPGDIVTLRNARFEGTHGAMKHKYRDEYGPLHVAVVEEWDGTRRAIRAWEQGRSKSKVRSEKFRLGDLRSGEVKVWRVVGRDWVEWETSS